MLAGSDESISESSGDDNRSSNTPHSTEVVAWRKHHRRGHCNLHLTHWGRVTLICVGKLTIIPSDNGLSPSWRQAIIWTNAGILLIGPSGTNFSEIQTFSVKKMLLKMSSAKWRPFCLIDYWWKYNLQCYINKQRVKIMPVNIPRLYEWKLAVDVLGNHWMKYDII